MSDRYRRNRLVRFIVTLYGLQVRQLGPRLSPPLQRANETHTETGAG